MTTSVKGPEVDRHNRRERTVAELGEQVGQVLGTGSSLEITGAMLRSYHDAVFGECGRADQSGTPAGDTADPFLVLSLLTTLTADLITVSDALSSVNYGLDDIVFHGAARAGMSVQAELTLASLQSSTVGQRAVFHARIHDSREGTTLCTAQWTVLFTTENPEHPKDTP